MNMVRAGVVSHPRKWSESGFNEIQNPPARYQIIDLDLWLNVLGLDKLDKLQATHNQWIDGKVENGSYKDARWSECLAVGSKDYLEMVQASLGLRAKYRQVESDESKCFIKENRKYYKAHLVLKKESLSAENGYCWK